MPKIGRNLVQVIFEASYETSGTNGFHLMYLVHKCQVYSCQETILAVILCCNTFFT